MNKIILEVFEEFEENKKALNNAQKEYIVNKYYNRLNFEYAEGHLCYMFKGKVTQINNLKHFVGLEYEEDEIETYIQHGNEALIVYNNCDRVSEFVEVLQKLEN